MKYVVLRHALTRRIYILFCFVCLVILGIDGPTTSETINAQSLDPSHDIFLPVTSGSPETSQPDSPSSEPTPSTEPTVRVQQLSVSNSTIEAVNQPVVFRIERSDNEADIEVSFAIGGSADAALASVSIDDLSITLEDGTSVADRITIPAGHSAVTVTVQALTDTNVEVPEIGLFLLQAGDGYVVDSSAAKVPFTARDKPSMFSNDSRIFVAMLDKQDGVNTNATGIATVRLYDDNHMGSVSVSFSGLTSPEIAAHIHEATTDNIVLSLPLGQVNNGEWSIEAADLLLTNQATLEALLSGQLYINIHTRDYPDGEIIGRLMPTSGSIEMPTPEAAEPVEDLSGAALKRDIARFLTQTTFGPVPDAFVDLEARIAGHDGDRIAAYSEWIDEQVQLESPSLLAFHNAYRPMYKETDPQGSTKFSYLKKGATEGWFTGAVYGKAQFRERIGFALSEIFVVSLEDSSIKNGPGSAASYYDMLRRNAFGSYKELLTNISTHPAMGWYLSHFQNQAEQRDEFGEVITSPDENYAREIMQLFSIGLVELHPDGSLKLGEDGLPIRTYDQTDITEMARVFTGWGMSVYNPDDGTTTAVAPNASFNFARHSPLLPYHPYWGEQMKMFEDNGFASDHRRYVLLHDNGEKTVLGTSIPAGLSGEADLERVMSLLSAHPNTAPFISYRLIQRLVTSNPSPGYLYRVATVFEATDGDLKAVLKAILLDSEARNLSFQEWDGYGKKKEPLVHFTAMLRLLQVYSAAADSYPLEKLTEYGMSESEVAHYEEDVAVLFLQSEEMAGSTVGFEQAPLRAPNVFNWFQPNFSPIGAVSSAGLVAPELQIATENQVMSYYNTFYELLLTDGLYAGEPQAKMDETPITYTIPQWLLDTYTTAMDSNGDGQITEMDAAFSDAVAVRNATVALVDMLDLYLCSGRLQANSADILATGDMNNDPYTIIVDGVVSIMATMDHTTATAAVEAREERIREALFLIGTTPDCLVQQ